MKIAIEAQRIFRPNKHGMDFVALESIRELQKRDESSAQFKQKQRKVNMREMNCKWLRMSNIS